MVCRDKKVPRDLVDQLDHVVLPASRDHPVMPASTDWMAPRDEEAKSEEPKEKVERKVEKKVESYPTYEEMERRVVDRSGEE